MELLSPLPPDAKVTRQPVGSPEVLASEHGKALAGMEQIVAEISRPGMLRIVLIVVERGKVTAVNDHITRWGASQVRAGDARTPATVHESAGGSFAPDGTLRGTRWTGRVVDDERATPEAPTTESTPSALSEADVAGLRALADALLERGSSA